MSNYSSFPSSTIILNNSLVESSTDEDDEDIERLMRLNAITQDLNSNQMSQQHVAVVTPKASSKTDWNDDHLLETRHATLPPALLKLDQQRAIPTLRHCNDILIEVEAYTIDSQRSMNRSGVRGGNLSKNADDAKDDGNQEQEEKPMEVETTSVDCIGRVVQLAENDSYYTAQQQLLQNRLPQHKIHHDIRVNDRIAAIYPFEYKLDKKKQLLLSRQTHHNDISNKQRYTLVDAGYAVKIPNDHNNNSASAACMTRVYTSAFQSIQLGLSPTSVRSSYLTNRRYSLNQLYEKSILIQDGTSELGRAWIQLSKVLGATHIFATASTRKEHAILRDELNVTPLRAESFSSELFMGEKLNLVLMQDFPSAHDFDMYYSLLDDARGVLVYCPREEGDNEGNNESGGDNSEEEKFDFGTLANVGCNANVPSLQEVVNKAKEWGHEAVRSLRLTCSSQFVSYRGVRASCKENKRLFKNDLAFLFKLLNDGKLKPHVEECISPEDIPRARNKIVSDGKRGTVVCLPAPLYEKKAVNVVSPINSPEDASHYSIASKWKDEDGGIVMNAESYAADAGYIVTHKKQFPYLTAATIDEELSDYHGINVASAQPSPFRPRLPSNSSDHNLQIEPAQSFATFTSSVSSVSVKAHDMLRDYNLLGKK